MFIHYDEVTNRITGITNFLSEIPETWDVPTIELESFDFIHPYDEYEIQDGVPVRI